MRPERWQQIDELLDAALALKPGECAAFLDQACRGDEELRRELESLLRANEQASRFIEEPPAETVAALLVEQNEQLIGRQIGPFKVMELLGRGGMGEVYKAQETTELERTVAIKVLPAELAADKQRMLRFVQEARTASSLNHPNILTVFEIGEADGIRFIATEFIEGETLRQRMVGARLALNEALDLAIQVAAALTAAHKANVVHRDIKPENIMRRRDGIVKVLDFGLAKLSERVDSQQEVDAEAATRGLVQTEPGVVMGTAAYMSPEQARGLAVDARTDIFSLGVVIYEMVAGQAPFGGTTRSDLIVALLERQPPPLVRFAPKAPAELERIVVKALDKDRDERYQTAKDLLIDLKRLKQKLEVEAEIERIAPPELRSAVGETKASDSREVVSTAPGAAALTAIEGSRKTSSAEYIVAEIKRHKRVVIVVIATLIVAAAGVAYIARLIYQRPKIAQVSPQTATPLTTDPGFEGMPSLSPDGNQVAFQSGGPQTDNFDIYVKQIGGGPARRLTSDPAVDEFPAWSPDGRSIAFIRDRGDKLEVLLIPSLGGPERKIAETVPDNSTFIFSWAPPSLSWSADSKYLVTTDRASPGEPLSLFVLSVATGEKRRLTTPPATALGDGNPAVSPDGRTLAFVRSASGGNAQLYVLPLSEDYKSAGEERHLDLSQPSVISPAWTADGQEIVCFAGQRWGEGRLWRVPVSGSERPQPLASVGPDDSQPTISRQGNRLVYAHQTEDEDIWRAEVSGRGRASPAVKLIASTRNDLEPEYSPDGSRIVFASERSGHSEVWVCNGDGSNPVQVTSLESTSGSPHWFPDGRRIVFDSDKEGHTEVYATDMTTFVPHRLTNESSDGGADPSVSHDGKWIYFDSRRTGRFEVWRMPAEGGEAVQVTRKGGWFALESPDGKAVYYFAPDFSGVWKVAVGGGEETRVLGPVAEFAVASEGIYFIEAGTRLHLGTSGYSLKFFSFAKGTTEKVADMKLNPHNGLCVSPDGRNVLFSQIDPFVCDLMLVENFH